MPLGWARVPPIPRQDPAEGGLFGLPVPPLIPSPFVRRRGHQAGAGNLPAQVELPPTEPRVAKSPDRWHAVPVRHRKPGSFVDQSDVEIARDPLPLEVLGKPTVFVTAQESKAPSGVSLAGQDTLGQFLALQRTVTEVESGPHPEHVASALRLRALVLRLTVALVLLAVGAIAVLDVHPG